MRELVKKHENYLIVIIIFIAILIRAAFVIVHFTHYDDVGLVVSILKNEGGFFSKFDYKAIIPWTYAPLQCWIIGLLINSRFSYAINLFLGRLPSLFFSVINLFLMWHIIKKIYPKKNLNYVERILSILLISFSWEMIIYSAQCEPYIIGVTGVLLLINEYLSIVESREIPIIRTIFIGAIVGYMQYQLFVFVFCFYVAIFLNFFVSKKDLIKIFLCSISSMLLDIPVIIDFLNTGMNDRGLNWNVGNQGQFMFDASNYAGIHKIGYMLLYFMKNIYHYINTMFVYKTTTWYSFVLCIILIVLTICGIIYAIKKRDKLSIYFALVILLTFILIIIGKLPLSPSRHLMIYIPISIYYIIRGITLIKEIGISKTQQIDCVMLFLAICFVTIFIVDIPTELIERKNKISEEIVSEWTEQDDVMFVGFYKDTFDLELMKISGYYQTIGGIQKENSDFCVGKKIVFYSRAHEITDTDLRFLDNYIVGNKLKLIDSVIVPSDVEVEYARGCFNNFGNGYFYYKYEIVEPESEEYDYAPQNVQIN